jgi:TolA-binding protein
VALAGGARARVAEVTEKGARVVLEEGEAGVHVVHAPGTAWSIEAGPFSVAVTGTTFDVGFHAAEQTLEVRMREGSVVVRGPQAEAGVALRAGQRLVAGSAEGTLRIEADAVPAPAAMPAPARTEPSSSPPTPRARPSPAAAPTSSASAVRSPEAGAASVPSAAPLSTTEPSAAAAPPVTWAQRVARGDFAGVIGEAEAKGIAATLASATLPDLAALADAARYGGKLDLARQALGAERARFPGSREASNAAFLLGRIADDAQGSPAAAAALYDQYLAESPGGAFAEEALGRKMVALRRSSGREAARGVAAEYLRRYPGGAFATAAREISQDP